MASHPDDAALPDGHGRPDTDAPVTDLGGDVYDLTLTDGRARYRAFLFDWDRPTLVDCGPPEAADTLLDRLRDLGIAPERLVLTHDHPDHVGGFDAVVDRYDPTTWVPTQSAPDTDHDPDRRFDHEDRVGPFIVVHVPGHTDNTYALVATDRDLAVMGDVMTGADWRGLPAGYFVPFSVGLVYHGSSVFADAREKLDRFLDFPNKGAWDV